MPHSHGCQVTEKIAMGLGRVTVPLTPEHGYDEFVRGGEAG